MLKPKTVDGILDNFRRTIDELEMCVECFNAIRQPLPPACPHCGASLRAENIRQLIESQA